MDNLGKTMFGRSLRLRVLLWVHGQKSHFYQTQAAQGVSYSTSGVETELARLEELGMIRRFARTGNVGRVNYLVVDSPLWTVIEAVEDVLGISGGVAQGGDT